MSKNLKKKKFRALTPLFLKNTLIKYYTEWKQLNKQSWDYWKKYSAEILQDFSPLQKHIAFLSNLEDKLFQWVRISPLSRKKKLTVHV